PLRLAAALRRPDRAVTRPLLAPVFGRKVMLPSRMSLLTSSRVIADWTRSISSASIQTLFKPPPRRSAASLLWLLTLIQNPLRSQTALRHPRHPRLVGLPPQLELQWRPVPFSIPSPLLFYLLCFQFFCLYTSSFPLWRLSLSALYV